MSKFYLHQNLIEVECSNKKTGKLKIDSIKYICVGKNCSVIRTQSTRLTT